MEFIMDTQSELSSSKTIIAYLAEQFPNCFTTEGNTKPLKIGIFQDIVDRFTDNTQFSKTKLRLALRLYTASWRYLYSIKEGAYRVDLDGNACDTISSEQAEHALTALKASKEKAKATKNIKNKQQATAVPQSRKPVSNQATKKSADLAAKSVVKHKRPKVKSVPKLNKATVNDIKIGSEVKIILGSKPVSATISNIEKEHIKVKVPSGMELTVTIEHILV